MISDLKEMRQEIEEKCLKFENELNVSNSVIKELNDKLEDKIKLVHDQDIKKLLEDNKLLKLMNEGK